MTFAAEQIGGVLQAALSIFGMTGGPSLGVFTLGMMFPWANAKGAFTGMLTSLIFMFWLGFGTNIAINNKELVTPNLPVRVDGCLHGNFTLPPPPIGNTGGVLEFYRISYIWYTLIGSFVTIVVGLFVSLLTGGKDPRTLDPRLISPPIDWFVTRCLPLRVQEVLKWDLGAMKKPAIAQNATNIPVSFGNSFAAHEQRNRNGGIENLGFRNTELEFNERL